MRSLIRALLWSSILVALASPARWLSDYLTAPTILLSLRDAIYSPHPRAGPNQHLFDVDGDVRLAIFSHPPSRLEWSLDLRPGPHRFLVEVALDPEAWDGSDGVRFKVVVVEGGKRRELGETTVDPKRRADDRRWIPVVSEFVTTTNKATLALVNDVGPAGRSDFDWAYWAEPRIVTLTRPPHPALILVGLFGVIGAAIAARRQNVTLAVDARRLALFVHSIAVSLIFTELLLRQFPSWLPPGGIVQDVAGPEYAAWADTLLADSELAYRHRPHLSLTLPRDFRRLVTDKVPAYVEPTIDRIRFETDEDGFRNARGGTRPEIIVLGDSFAAGDLMDGGDTVSAVLSREMGVEVRSLAVSGYGPQQYLAALRNYGIKDRPRLVVVVLFEGNDIDDAEEFVRWQRSNLTWLEYFTKEQRTREPSIIMRPRMRPRWLAALTRIGADMRAMVSSPTRVNRPEDPFNPVCRTNADPLDCMSFNGTMIFRETLSPEEWQARPGLSLTLDALREMKTICERTETRVLVVLGPTKESIYLPRMAADVEPGTLDRYLEVVTRGVPIPPGPTLSERFATNNGTVGRLLRDALKREGIAVLDLRPGLEEAADQDRNLFFRFDLHWNEAGHAEVARLIERAVKERGWFEQLSQDPGSR